MKFISGDNSQGCISNNIIDFHSEDTINFTINFHIHHSLSLNSFLYNRRSGSIKCHFIFVNFSISICYSELLLFEILGVCQFFDGVRAHICELDGRSYRSKRQIASVSTNAFPPLAAFLSLRVLLKLPTHAVMRSMKVVFDFL